MFNTLRIIFLVFVTITLKIDTAYTSSQWLAAYIYTFSNTIVILIYLLGFSTKPTKIESLLSQDNSLIKSPQR
jgi:hypothetical protein